MISFEKLWKTMQEKGFSTYVLREKCGIDSKTVRRLKANENVETKTLDKLCTALDCKIEDIVEFIKEYCYITKTATHENCVAVNFIRAFYIRFYEYRDSFCRGILLCRG